MTALRDGQVSYQIITDAETRRAMKVLAAQNGRTLQEETNLALHRYLAAEQPTGHLWVAVGAAEQVAG